MIDQKLQELVLAAMSGGDGAFQALWEAKGRSVLFTATRMMGSREDGEDVAQEVWIKLHRGITKLKEPRYFDVWLYRVILNECNMMRRKMTGGKMNVPAEEYADRILERRVEFLPQEFVENDEKKRLLLAAVQGLKPKYRQLVLLHYYDDLSYPEIAAVTGLSVPAVANSLARARKHIRRELERGGAVSWRDVPAFAPLPVVTRALREQAKELFSDGAVRGFGLELLAAAPVAAAAHNFSGLFKALAGVAAAAAVACAAIFGFANAPAQTFDPLPPSAAAAPGVPQQPAAAAGGSLEIDETLAPQAGKTPDGQPPEPPQAEAPAAQELPEPGPQTGPQEPARQAEVCGSVALTDATGAAVPGGAKYLAGIGLALVDANGGTVAQTAPDADGRFSFGMRSADAGERVALVCAGTPYAAADANPQGSLPAAAGMALYVKKEGLADMEIAFTGGECGCGHVNPDAIAIQTAEALPLTHQWTVRDADGARVAAGSAARISKEIKNLAPGAYTVEWEVADITGNRAVLKKVFSVAEGPVDPNQFE